MNSKEPNFTQISEWVVFMQGQQLTTSQKMMLEMLANNPNPTAKLILNMPRRPNKAITLRMLREMFKQIEHDKASPLTQ